MSAETAPEAVVEDFNPAYWIAGTEATESRILHTMMRISDPEATMRFYIDGLGMKLVHRFELESKRLTAYFFSYQEDSVDGLLELAHVWDAREPYALGNGYGHIAVGFPDFEAAFARLEAMGAEVVKHPYKLFDSGPKLAMVKDPDGYVIELVQARR